MPERDGGHDFGVGIPATFVDRVRPDGTIVRWESRRRHRHLKERAAGSILGQPLR